MRVICVDATGIGNSCEPLVEGLPYTAIDELEVDGKNYYELQEYKMNNGKRCIWSTWRFIPCSDIDETELINERLLESPLTGVQ